MLFSAWLAAWVPQAMAADAQLDGARSLLEHGRYQDAYAMLCAPQMQAMPSGTEFDLLLARAALETGNTAQAKAP
ncbi:MAG: hypothetical protein LH491_07580 [Pseudoxanthomonas sp.]|nr:hypothetical protein [Pseudoxanthomonas sp.]